MGSKCGLHFLASCGCAHVGDDPIISAGRAEGDRVAIDAPDWLLHGPIRSTISLTASCIPMFYLPNRGREGAAGGASHPAGSRDMAVVQRRGYFLAYSAMVLVLASMQWAGLRGAAAFQLQHARGLIQQGPRLAPLRRQAVRTRGLLRGTSVYAHTRHAHGRRNAIYPRANPSNRINRIEWNTSGRGGR